MQIHLWCYTCWSLWWPESQLITSPHACAEVGLGLDLKRAITRTEDERATIVPATRLLRFMFTLNFLCEPTYRRKRCRIRGRRPGLGPAGPGPAGRAGPAAPGRAGPIKSTAVPRPQSRNTSSSEKKSWVSSDFFLHFRWSIESVSIGVFRYFAYLITAVIMQLAYDSAHPPLFYPQCKQSHILISKSVD